MLISGSQCSFICRRTKQITEVSTSRCWPVRVCVLKSRCNGLRMYILTDGRINWSCASPFVTRQEVLNESSSVLSLVTACLSPAPASRTDGHLPPHTEFLETCPEEQDKGRSRIPCVLRDSNHFSLQDIQTSRVLCCVLREACRHVHTIT